MHGRGMRQQAFVKQTLDLLAHKLRCLFHKDAHGQTPDQPSGRLGVQLTSLVQPGHDDGCGLAKACWYLQYVRPWRVGQALLIG